MRFNSAFKGLKCTECQLTGDTSVYHTLNTIKNMTDKDIELILEFMQYQLRNFSSSTQNMSVTCSTHCSQYCFIWKIMFLSRFTFHQPYNEIWDLHNRSILKMCVSAAKRVLPCFKTVCSNKQALPEVSDSRLT